MITQADWTLVFLATSSPMSKFTSNPVLQKYAAQGAPSSSSLLTSRWIQPSD